jgi:hypothetical protein
MRHVGVDNYSDHPGSYDQPAEPVDVASAIGSDERRMHVRAYNYWYSLLKGRDYPSIEDLDPANLADFGPNSVLLDFTSGGDNPATAYIGGALRTECDLDDGVRTIADVPNRSLLTRLTDHYMQIIANRAPVGFEAEFTNQRGRAICYRGILMPFSSDGDTIDFIYGVINWKDEGQALAATDVVVPMLDPGGIAESNTDGEEAELLELTDRADPHLTWEDGPLADADAEPETAGEIVFDETDDDDEVPIVADDAGLADRLWAARESAEVCKQADGRSRAALYRALAMAYDFAVACQRVPEDYAEILDDAGVKAQARAPMTPIVKLVFGVDYDKTRLTEFAAALSNAERNHVEFGGFEAFLDAADGGLKGLVAAERQARRPDKPVTDKAAAGRARLRSAAPLALAQLATNEEFALVLTRRNADGVHEVVELVADDSLLDRALRRAGH